MRIVFAIPTKDRHPALARSIHGLACGTNGRMPTIVCDQSKSPHPAPGVLHRPDLTGLPAARNVLLRAAEAEFVVFLDDDTDLGADFAARLEACIARWPDAAGWGPVLEVRPRAVRRVHRLVHLGCFHDPRRLTGARIDAGTSALFGACFAVRRAEALAVGFDERRAGYALGEDLDFCRRLLARTGRREFRFCRELRAIHRRDGAGRADPRRRGRAKGDFLVWLARRHGGRNPCTLLHLLLALAVAALGRGEEPAAARGVWAGARPWLW